MRGGSEGGAAAPARPLLPSGGRMWDVAMVVLLVLVAAMMLYLTRGLTFNLDEWVVVTERRGPGAPSLLEPHNEHLSVLLLAIYLTFLKIGGLDAIGFMMVPLVALQLALGVLLYVIARPRVGAGVGVAVAATALLCGLAYENFLVAGQFGQMASIVAGVAAFHVLDLPRTRRRDLVLAGLMTVALTMSGMGIPIVLGVAVELALTPAGRARIWVVGAPFGAYVAWYLFLGTSRVGFEEVTLSVLWFGTALNHAAGAIIGERQIEPGRDFLLLLLVVLCYRAFRVRREGRIRMAALAVVLLTFYGLTAVSRYDIAPPSSSRYLTVGVVFLLLALVEAARGWRIRRWVPYVVIVLALMAFNKRDGNKQAFREGRSLFLERSQRVKSSLGAVELLGRQRVDPDLEIAPLAAPLLDAGGWFRARDGLRGNPAYGPGELPRAAAAARASADDTLVRGGGLVLSAGGAPPRTCVAPWRGHEGRVPAGGVWIAASATRPLALSARRFGPDWMTLTLLPLPAGTAATVRPLADASPVPYVIRTQGTARACRLG